MPSFDITSTVNPMEIENAVHQAKKELATRFDFKEVKAGITQEKNEIRLEAPDEFRLRALEEMVLGRLARREISLKSVERRKPEVSPLGHARQTLVIRQGIDPAAAKEIAAFIRELKLKITAQIQGDELRVSGKNRDDLQAVIAAVRARDFPVALSFGNFRD